MSIPLDEYRCTLINNILFADSQEEVKQVCDSAMKALERHKVNGHIIARFTDKMINGLEQFNPMKKDARQWSNIKLAKILFNRIKHQLKAPVE